MYKFLSFPGKLPWSVKKTTVEDWIVGAGDAVSFQLQQRKAIGWSRYITWPSPCLTGNFREVQPSCKDSRCVCVCVKGVFVYVYIIYISYIYIYIQIWL